MTDNSNGRAWARWTLALALLCSVVGNVWHTVLAESAISLYLRVPAAVIWPLFTFLGIEVLVRMVWERSFTHRLARNMVIFPAIPAAVVSYEHLHGLLLLMGERPFIAIIGPLAIDGAMIGCTMALLFTRARPIGPMPAPPQEITDEELDATLARWSIGQEAEQSAPVSPAAPDKQWAIDVLPETQAVGRQQRFTLEQQERALRRMLDGATPAQAEAETGVSLYTTRRYQTGINRARADVNAELKGIPVPLAAIIRNHMTGLERAR